MDEGVSRITGKRLAARRERAAFGQDLHVVHAAHEGRAAAFNVGSLGGIITRHERKIVDQRVEDFRGLRVDRAGFEIAVIEIVQAAFTNRLRVGVGLFGLGDENFRANRTHRANIALLAGDHRAGTGPLQPLGDVAILH